VTKKVYTIMVVPEDSAKIRRFKVAHRTLLKAALAGILALGALCFGIVNYVFVMNQSSENRSLKNDNVLLQTRLRLAQDEINRVDDQLERIGQFAQRLRTITQLNDPDRKLAVGPLNSDVQDQPQVLYVPGERIEFEDEIIDSNVALGLIDAALEEVDERAAIQERSMRELDDFFTQDASLLASMPSIRPNSSMLTTSLFGPRTDPYTNRKVMHKGVDIAAEHGSDVYVTGDGVVVFAGNRGGYGKSLVVDHGFGFQTHYTHLSSYQVSVGQEVKRGQSIGAVGNTGRSTGPHLHYEVRLNGVPQDPLRYMIE
jgi:murein DD-endopeptidase MepM/ murein hydrolase activator NlpD